MEIGERRSDYKEINLRLFIAANSSSVQQTSMACDGGRQLLHLIIHASGLTASIALKGEFSGTIRIVSYLWVKGHNDRHEGHDYETHDNRIGRSVRPIGDGRLCKHCPP
jgi:hypothetical protein